MMLAGLGETAIVNLENPAADIVQAITILDSVTEDVQLTGWHFNKEENFLLIADEKGCIDVPVDVHRVTFKSGKNYLLKNSKLYDAENHTFIIGQDIEADITRILAFEQIPKTFQRYIAMRAARKYQNNVLGSDSIRSFQERDEMEARFTCLKEEQAIQRPNVKGGYIGILNGWSVSKTLRR